MKKGVILKTLFVLLVALTPLAFSMNVPVQWSIHDQVLYLLPDDSLFVKDVFAEQHSLTEYNYYYPGYHSQSLTYSNFLYTSRDEGQRYRLFISRPTMGASVVYARDITTERVSKGGSGYYSSPSFDFGCSVWDHSLTNTGHNSSTREYYSFLYSTLHFSSSNQDMLLGINYETINHISYGANRLYGLYFDGLYGFGLKYTRVELERLKTREYAAINYTHASDSLSGYLTLRRLVSGDDYAPMDIEGLVRYNQAGIRRVAIRDYFSVKNGRNETQFFYAYSLENFTIEPYVAYIDYMRTTTLGYVGEDVGVTWSASYGKNIMGFTEGYHSMMLGGNASLGVYATVSLFETDLGISCRGWYYSKREMGDVMNNGFNVAGEIILLRRLGLLWEWNDIGKDDYRVDFTITWEFEG